MSQGKSAKRKNPIKRDKLGRFIKGHTGRPKGAKGKTPKAFQELLLAVVFELEKKKQTKLIEFARKNPTEFYKLASKILPKQVDSNVNVDGEIKLSWLK